MGWKIGDKVRLTGAQWPTYKGNKVRRGSEHTVTSVKPGRVSLSGWDDGYHWKVEDGWEIELVERKDSVMSVDFSDVNVGDKVRMTRENGDEATFTVRSKASRGDYLESESNAYWEKDWDTLEIVEREFKPVPGLYSDRGGSRVVLLENGEAYYTASDGAWITIEPDDHEDILREQDGWSLDKIF